MTGLHELGLAAAARAIRNGDVSSETYVGTMAVNEEGLPLGLELDAAAGRDLDLLALARRVEWVLGHVPRPPGTSRDLVYSTDAQR
jgi:hypothetical protein